MSVDAGDVGLSFHTVIHPLPEIQEGRERWGKGVHGGLKERKRERE